MHTKQLSLAIAAILGSQTVLGCDLDIPNLNNPSLTEIEENPTRASTLTAATGLLIAQRAAKATTVGYVNQLGILGRESYDFDANDQRFVSEELQSTLVKNSAFGGVFWRANYAAIRLVNIVLHGAEKVADFTDQERAGIKGFAHTIEALELLTVIITHGETGAVIDTDHPLGGELGAIVPRDEVYAEISRLLDLAATEELPNAGDTFPFILSDGYVGFDTPSKKTPKIPTTFLEFNRAIKARVAVYQASLAALKKTPAGDAIKAAKYAEAKLAIDASFIDDTSEMLNLDAGVNYVYSLAAGDTANALISTAIYAHPKLITDAQKQADGVKPDERLTNKTVALARPVTSTVDTALTTTIRFSKYQNITPIPLIRNEELILLRAEILWFTGDKSGAIAALNTIRTTSGKLAPLSPSPTTDEEFITALLYERRYSLLFEGGHRWIDLRRFGIPLPLDVATHTRNVRFPVPQAECDARPGEPACTVTSDAIIPP
jgi:hypothetical protein